ncbi:Exodeoxyribonuclease VII small subunit [Lachnospiraceae bacterium C7]|nr:Exodeoxyribonuclease VII small subunit [Lachnospiraceae bacterium C7]
MKNEMQNGLQNETKNEMQNEAHNDIKSEIKEENSLTLEQRFANLEDLISKMESSDVSLEESFELYKKGLDQVKESYKVLESVEGQMAKLCKNGELEEI